jgi:hypothetical protein
MTRVATPKNEAQLLEFAIYATGAQLERICRGYRGALAVDRPVCPEDRSVRRRVLPGGMVKVELVLCPDMRAIDCAREVGHANAEREPAPDAAAAARKCDNDHGHVSAESCKESAAWPSRPDGAVALAEGFLAGNAAKGNGGERYQVLVNVDHECACTPSHAKRCAWQGPGAIRLDAARSLRDDTASSLWPRRMARFLALAF